MKRFLVSLEKKKALLPSTGKIFQARRSDLAGRCWVILLPL